MLGKLAQLSDEAFYNLKTQIDIEAKNRQRRALSVGKIATFDSTKRGGQVMLMITGRGPKNITGYEIDSKGNHLTNLKWRINPSMLTPYIKPTPKIKPTGVGQDRPTVPSIW